jgi:hypothetical protein
MVIIVREIILFTPNYRPVYRYKVQGWLLKTVNLAPGVISMYLGTAEACTLLAAEGGRLRGVESEYMGCIQGGAEGGKVLNHPCDISPPLRSPVRPALDPGLAPEVSILA